jgi:transcriptional regulator with XRE-family HTH domain
MSTGKPYKDAGKRLIVIKKALSLDQKGMAEKLGISRSTYQHYERGERSARGWVLEKLISFGVNPVWLLTGEGQPFEPATLNQTAMPCTIDSHQAGDRQDNIIDAEHTELVEQLNDKKMAMEISHHLLEIECINKSAFKETCAYIKGIAAGLKSMVAYDRRKCERRQRNDEYRSPEQERRIEERRKAVGE